MITIESSENYIKVVFDKMEFEIFKRILVHADHDMKLFHLSYFLKEKKILSELMEL